MTDVFIQLDLMGIYLCICKEAHTFGNMSLVLLDTICTLYSRGVQCHI